MPSPLPLSGQRLLQNMAGCRGACAPASPAFDRDLRRCAPTPSHALQRSPGVDNRPAPLRKDTLHAEIVTIGTELLLGEIVDTNSAWIAKRLTTIGLDLYYTTTVGDNLGRIADALRRGLARSNVVITTGGLGPTVDDVTRQAVAEATDRELVLDQELVQEISRYFARRGHRMTENNRKQAHLPEGARVIHNPVGTAPAFAVDHNGHVVICLPGVPHEMRYLIENEVLPYLRERYGLRGVIKSRTLRTCGIGESTVDSRIGDLMRLSNPTVGTRAHPGQTDVQITAKADSEAEADALIAPVEAELRARLGDVIFGVDEETMADVVIRLLTERGLCLALVETVTRGELAQRLSAAARGGQAFAGSMVLGNAEALHRALGVPAGLVSEDSFPSQDVADAAARAVRRLQAADVGLA
ncbi:MAG: CinA family nicotinamide mononucleotide deamidase-related protein, partial [Anaerolineales bacterium]